MRENNTIYVRSKPENGDWTSWLKQGDTSNLTFGTGAEQMARGNHTHSYKDLSDKPTIPIVDTALSSTSTNPVQNKVVTNALNSKANSSHTHSYKELSDKPTIPVVDSALSSTSTNAIQNKDRI